MYKNLSMNGSCLMFVGHDFASFMASQVAVGCPNFWDIQGVLQ